MGDGINIEFIQCKVGIQAKMAFSGDIGAFSDTAGRGIGESIAVGNDFTDLDEAAGGIFHVALDIADGP